LKTIPALLLVVVLAVVAAAQDRKLPPPIIDMHVHAASIAWFEKLAGPPPIPHCVPMMDYPVPRGGTGWPDIFRSRDLPCRQTWSPLTETTRRDFWNCRAKRLPGCSDPQEELTAEREGNRARPRKVNCE
jgi:hypothetical protein